MPGTDPGDQGSGGLPLVASDGRLTLRDWLPSIVEEIVAGFSPRRVILFGSIARGDETAESDVDLMVVFDHLDRAHRRELQGRLMAAVSAPVPFDIFVMDAAEYEAKKDVNGTIAYWPAREGVVVHERSIA
jgi:predicted nucleotidyltransferase